MTRKLSFLLAGTLLLFGLVLVFRIENIGTTALWNLSDGGKWLLPLVGVAALIDSINPCAFSVLLLTIAFLLSIGKLRSSVLAIGGAYILGIFLVYLVIGLGLLHDHATYFNGVGYLIMYNLIFILPLLLILLIASDQTLLAKVQAWQQGERKAMRWGGGAAMVALGMVIFAI